MLRPWQVILEACMFCCKFAKRLQIEKCLNLYPSSLKRSRESFLCCRCRKVWASRSIVCCSRSAVLTMQATCCSWDEDKTEGNATGALRAVPVHQRWVGRCGGSQCMSMALQHDLMHDAWCSVLHHLAFNKSRGLIMPSHSPLSFPLFSCRWCWVMTQLTRDKGGERHPVI